MKQNQKYTKNKVLECSSVVECYLVGTQPWSWIPSPSQNLPQSQLVRVEYEGYLLHYYKV